LEKTLRVTPLQDKMREDSEDLNTLKGRSIDVLVRRCVMIDILECERGRRSLKEDLNEIIKLVMVHF